MGFYLRKSVKVGPFRLNFSKSGVGVSTGIKGLRFGSGPRGNYVHMGLKGIYYRKTFSPGRTQPDLLPRDIREPGRPVPPPQDLDAGNLQEIKSASVLELMDSSPTDLIDEIKNKSKLISFWPFVAVTSLAAAYVVSSYRLPEWSLYLVLAVSALLTLYVRKHDRSRKTAVLNYELDHEIAESFTGVKQSFNALMSSSKIWQIAAEGDVKDRKYHAGAGKTVDRKPVSFGIGTPKLLSSNINVPCVPNRRQTLFFFPDRILLFDGGNVAAIPYKALSIEVSQTRFIEEESVPAEARIVDHTWKYVNKKGGPDKRFKDNRQIPVVVYGQVNFASTSGLRAVFMFSKLEAGLPFQIALAAHSKLQVF